MSRRADGDDLSNICAGDRDSFATGADNDLAAKAVAAGPAHEPAGLTAPWRPTGEPQVDVGLRASGQGLVVGAQPAQQFDGPQDALVVVADRQCRPAGQPGPAPSDHPPRGVSADHTTVFRVVDSLELVVDPCFQAGRRLVALRQSSGGHQHVAQMGDGSVRAHLVEGLVREGHFAAGQPLQCACHGGFVEPAQDCSRRTGGGQHGPQRRHLGPGRAVGGGQQRAETVSQVASKTAVVAPDAVLVATALADPHGGQASAVRTEPTVAQDPGVGPTQAATALTYLFGLQYALVAGGTSRPRRPHHRHCCQPATVRARRSTSPGAGRAHRPAVADPIAGTGLLRT